MNNGPRSAPLVPIDLSFQESAYCVFGLRSNSLDPAVVSGELQIVPTHMFRSGEAFETAAGRRARSTGLWAFCIAGRSISQLAEDHAQVLLELLEPKLKELTEVRARFGALAVVQVVVESDANVGGADLKSVTLARLARICDELHFFASLTSSTDFEPVPGLHRPS